MESTFIEFNDDFESGLLMQTIFFQLKSFSVKLKHLSKKIGNIVTFFFKSKNKKVLGFNIANIIITRSFEGSTK